MSLQPAGFALSHTVMDSDSGWVRMQTQQQAMVSNQLMPVGVGDSALLEAIQQVRREAFLPEALQPLAYSDAALPLPHSGRMLMAPMDLARLLQAASPQSGEKLLVLGGATGYSAAVAAQLAARVVMVEPEREWFELARTALTAQGIRNVECVCQPLEESFSLESPFDVVLVEGGFIRLPENLSVQLARQGRMVGIRKQPGYPGGTAVLMTQSEEGWQTQELFDADMPLLPWQSVQKASFVF